MEIRKGPYGKFATEKLSDNEEIYEYEKGNMVHYKMNNGTDIIEASYKYDSNNNLIYVDYNNEKIGREFAY